MSAPDSSAKTRAPGIGRARAVASLTLTGERGSEAADEAGLRDAFIAHGSELFGFARKALDDSSAAEEVVQETFIRAWRARHRFDSSLGSLRTWLFAIERNVVIDHARARAIRETEPLPEEVAVGGDEVERAMVGWQVEDAVRRLRSEHRQVLLETYYRERSSRDVAVELGIPEGTVRSRLFYALRSLRLVLEEMGWEP
ncbi:MAG: sigma-70 family RNA polymerase sigma factor [Acidimicrobiales bacterium]